MAADMPIGYDNNDVLANNYAPLPVTLVRGEGAYLRDDAGHRYLDFTSAYSAVSHGHAHPRLVAALTEQAAKLAVTSRAFNNDQLGPFLRKLCAIAGLDKALPMNTGARLRSVRSRSPHHPLSRQRSGQGRQSTRSQRLWINAWHS
jgi:acetylornithine/succinyldiaminopimelate/putrescine aminotransferase